MRTAAGVERQNRTDVAAVVGRWQVDDLTEGHRSLLDSVMERHGKVIVFIGIAPVIGSRSNPLDYSSRAAMVLQHYPSAVVLPIVDMPSNEAWSKALDASIRTIAPAGEVTLYGGRDSFVQHYSGQFPCVELADMHYTSGTEIRREVGRRVRPSANFRAGVIYSCHQQRRRNNLVVDVAVLSPLPGSEKELGVLVGEKRDDKGCRFPGGFVDFSDPSVEAAGRREVEEETGIAVDGLEYIGSFQQDDWRMGESDRMLTLFFVGRRVMGHMKAGDDLDEACWAPVEKLGKLKWHSDHEKLRDALLAYLAKGKEHGSHGTM